MRRRLESPPRARWLNVTTHARQWRNTAKAEPLEVGEGSAPNGDRDVSEGVAAGVTVRVGVARCSDPHAVQRDDARPTPRRHER